MIMTREMAAEYLVVSVATIDNWTKGKPYLPFIKLGNSIRYRAKDLETFLDGKVTARDNEVPA